MWGSQILCNTQMLWDYYYFSPCVIVRCGKYRWESCGCPLNDFWLLEFCWKLNRFGVKDLMMCPECVCCVCVCLCVRAVLCFATKLLDILINLHFNVYLAKCFPPCLQATTATATATATASGNDSGSYRYL